MAKRKDLKMTIDEIKQGESDTLEFKREMPSKDSKLLKTIVAFSNGRGGKIVFGVDNRTLDIVGIEASKVFKFMDIYCSYKAIY